MRPDYQNYKVGILGGGQLGRMLIQAGIDLNVRFAVLDPDAHAPCSSIAEFHQGSLVDFDTVMRFGSMCDVITIEIENVNTTALRELQRQGKSVFPQPEVIELIQDKRSQKEFYRKRSFATADFILTENAADVHAHKDFLPAVNKIGREGYDGRGVQIMRSEGDLVHAFDAPGLLEKLVDFDKEIAVIAARNVRGDIVTYPAVEMVFHPTHNLVEYLFAPAILGKTIALLADKLARDTIGALEMVGLLAVEMFVTTKGEVLINEIAPRPHNSGHQTIEANVTSQYQQHLRAILDLPLGSTDMVQPGAMINLLGEAGHNGPARYQGLDEILKMKGVHVHLYGKRITKPFRKMGHVTITDPDMDSLKKKATFVKETLKVIA